MNTHEKARIAAQRNQSLSKNCRKWYPQSNNQQDPLHTANTHSGRVPQRRPDENGVNPLMMEVFDL
jgi:hypothetical protein